MGVTVGMQLRGAAPCTTNRDGRPKKEGNRSTARRANPGSCKEFFFAFVDGVCVMAAANLQTPFQR
jgi:hypothetical protein